MSQATISFRINKDIKDGMEKSCRDMGLTMTSAFTVFAKKVADEQRIPFEISAKKSNPLFLEDMPQKQIEEKLLRELENLDDANIISQEQLITNMKTSLRQ